MTPMTPMNREKFHGNRSARFSKNRKTHTQTDVANLYIYK